MSPEARELNCKKSCLPLSLFVFSVQNFGSTLISCKIIEKIKLFNLHIIMNSIS